MKMISLLTILLMTQTGLASTNLVTSLLRNQEARPEVSVGFHDSSFDYHGNLKPDHKTICFTQDISSVCAEIQSAETTMNTARGEGAHDGMRLSSCAVQGEAVRAEYRLFDDYGTSLKISRDIEACLK